MGLFTRKTKNTEEQRGFEVTQETLMSLSNDFTVPVHDESSREQQPLASIGTRVSKDVLVGKRPLDEALVLAKLHNELLPLAYHVQLKYVWEETRKRRWLTAVFTPAPAEGQEGSELPPASSPELLERYTTLLVQTDAVIREEFERLPQQAAEIDARRELLKDAGRDPAEDSELVLMERDFAERTALVKTARTTIVEALQSLNEAVTQSKALVRALEAQMLLEQGPGHRPVENRIDLAALSRDTELNRVWAAKVAAVIGDADAVAAPVAGPARVNVARARQIEAAPEGTVQSF